MHVIARKELLRFIQVHPDSKNALIRWFNLMKKSDFASYPEIQSILPSTDKVCDLIVFNIGGNKYRFIASIHFNRGKVYIRHILTHREYDKGAWKQ